MNLLSRETSPYLLQHKDNPVHWMPWGQDAFDRAKLENKPILLSVGYSACHWCHVMEHESFMDVATADIMNSTYICIKVDREERPDIDAIYQQALSLMGKQGGWPLTMFLTQDRAPFYGGTYFPPEAKYGLPSFKQALTGVAESYHAEKDKITHNVDTLTAALQKLQTPEAGNIPAPQEIERLAKSLLRQIDTAHGGLGGAPKFPCLPVMEWLWSSAISSGDAARRDAVISGLSAMCQGGIYDHIGGGFHRYTVDEEWLVPHFEKMLSDNVQFIHLLTLLFKETKNPLFEARVSETISFLLTDMRDGSAFASSFDADSDGKEGIFYVWREDEIDAVLGSDAAFFKQAYDITKFGNWEGVNIPNRLQHQSLLTKTEETLLQSCRQKLRAVRHTRTAPARDDKILTDLNGMTIAAITQAADVFGVASWKEQAITAYDAVRDIKLPHSRCGGRAGSWGLLDDYAHMIRAALFLHGTTRDPKYLTDAVGWADFCLMAFQDKSGGFFMTTADADMTIRPKILYDLPQPCGNSVMLSVLLWLYQVTEDEKYRAAYEKSVTVFAGRAANDPFGSASFLQGLTTNNHSLTVTLGGDVADDFYPKLCSLYVPDMNILFGDTQKGAVICSGQTCLPPIHDFDQLQRLLLEKRVHKAANDG